MSNQSVGRPTWKLSTDEYPPRRKRLLLIEDRDEDFGPYVIASESIPERMKTAKEHYTYIIKCVNAYEANQAELQRLRVECERLQELVRRAASAIHCPKPHCDDTGAYPYPLDGDPQPCEFCYSVANSVFNVLAQLTSKE